MTSPAACPHEVWDYEKKGDKQKSASGLMIMVCRGCGTRSVPALTKFSALSYMDPNRLRELAIDDPERYRKLVEKADAYQAEAVRKARERIAREDARRQVPPSNGKRPSNGNA